MGLKIHIFKKDDEGKFNASAELKEAASLAAPDLAENAISIHDRKVLGKMEFLYIDFTSPDDNSRVSVLTISNKETNTIYFITFLVPADQWDKYSHYKKIGKLIVVDDEI